MTTAAPPSIPRYDLRWCYAQARRAVRGFVSAYPEFEADTDDLVQLVVMRAHAVVEEGHRVSRRSIALFVRSSVARLNGDLRYAGRARLRAGTQAGGDLVASVAPGISPELALSLWRVQRVWTGLTDLERAGLRCLLTGGGYTAEARRLGSTQPSVWRAAQRAVALIRSPAYRRGNGALRRERLEAQP